MKDVPSVQLSRLSLLAMKISPAPEMRKCGGASRISIAPLLWFPGKAGPWRVQPSVEVGLRVEARQRKPAPVLDQHV